MAPTFGGRWDRQIVLHWEGLSGDAAREIVHRIGIIVICLPMEGHTQTLDIGCSARTIAHFRVTQCIDGRKVLNLKSYVETRSISRFFYQRIWKRLFSFGKAFKIVSIWLFAGLDVSLGFCVFIGLLAGELMFSVLNEQLSIWSYLSYLSLARLFRLFSWYALSIGLSLMGFTAFVLFVVLFGSVSFVSFPGKWLPLGAHFFSFFFEGHLERGFLQS